MATIDTYSTGTTGLTQSAQAPSVSDLLTRTHSGYDVSPTMATPTLTLSGNTAVMSTTPSMSSTPSGGVMVPTSPNVPFVPGGSTVTSLVPGLGGRTTTITFTNTTGAPILAALGLPLLLADTAVQLAGRFPGLAVADADAASAGAYANVMAWLTGTPVNFNAQITAVSLAAGVPSTFTGGELVNRFADLSQTVPLATVPLLSYISPNNFQPNVINVTGNVASVNAVWGVVVPNDFAYTFMLSY